MGHSVLIAAVIAIVATPAAQPAQGRGTPAEAEAMLAKAIAHYETAGRTQALADFTAREAPFADRDLYVFCFGADRTVVSHGGDPAQVGVSFDTLKDVDGTAFGAAIWEAGQQPAGGRVEYKWLNPATGAIEPKVTFVRKAGDDVCGVGAYVAPK